MSIATETTLQHVKPSEIAQHPRNQRKVVGDVSDIVESAETMGILEPLIVAPWPDTIKASAAQKKKHLLIAGHRRLQAAKDAQLVTVPVILRADLDTEAKQLEAMLVENLHRSDLTPVEEGDAYQALLEFPGFTQARLAKDIGQPISRIRERLKISKLAAPVKARLHDGQITIVDALAIDEFADDTKVSADLLKAAGTDDFRRALQVARNHREHNAAVEKRLAVLKEAGLKVVKTAPGKPAQRIDSYDGLQLVPNEFRYGGEASKLDKWVIANHAACEGALVAVVEEYGTRRISYWCTTPKVHPKAKVTKTPAEIKAAKKEAARKAECREQNAINTPLRREHLRAALTTVSEDAAKARLIANLTEGVPYYVAPARGEVLCQVLGVDPPTVEQGEPTWENFVEVLTPALQKLSLLGLVVISDVSANAESEIELDGIKDWLPGDAKDWLRALVDVYGYAASDFEKDRANLIRTKGEVQ
jgi:ParB family chromosome partitioning protein